MLEGNTSFALQSVSPSLTPSVKYRGSKPLRKRNKCISLSSSSCKAPPGEKRVEKKNAAMFQSLSWPQLRHTSLQKQITMETLATLLLHFLDHQPRQHKILCSFTETNNNANLRHRHTVMKWKNGQAKKVVSHIIYKRWGEKGKKNTGLHVRTSPKHILVFGGLPTKWGGGYHNPNSRCDCAQGPKDARSGAISCPQGLR